jgi:hypothetical protein
LCKAVLGCYYGEACISATRRSMSASAAVSCVLRAS